MAYGGSERPRMTAVASTTSERSLECALLAEQAKTPDAEARLARRRTWKRIGALTGLFLLAMAALIRLAGLAAYVTHLHTPILDDYMLWGTDAHPHAWQVLYLLTHASIAVLAAALATLAKGGNFVAAPSLRRLSQYARILWRAEMLMMFAPVLAGLLMWRQEFALLGINVFLMPSHVLCAVTQNSLGWIYTAGTLSPLVFFVVEFGISEDPKSQRRPFARDRKK